MNINLKKSKMVKKTKKEIEKYVRIHKKDFLGVYERNKKDFIYFYNKLGKFTGYIPKTRTSISAVKKIIEPLKAKIRIKFKNRRGKQTLVYKIYNLKQRDELLFRMNKKLRNKFVYKGKQRKRKLKDTKFRDDAVPISGKKKVIDLTFDKFKWESVIIEKIEGVSP